MQKTSRNNIKLNQRIVERIKQCMSSIHAMYDGNLVEISIFGSFAKGGPSRFSSIDMLIVLKESTERFITRNASIQRLLNEDDLMPMIDPLVYTEAELLELIKKKESFIISVLKESVVVWNDFEPIEIEKLTEEHNVMHSRYQSAIPDLEEIDMSI
jgi:predicted nucleotidyltransferase